MSLISWGAPPLTRSNWILRVCVTERVEKGGSMTLLPPLKTKTLFIFLLLYFPDTALIKIYGLSCLFIDFQNNKKCH